MSNKALQWGRFVVAIIAICTVAHLFAQSPKERSDDEIPRAALLTERGRELAEELRMLKRTRDSLGSKHPTLPVVLEKIEQVKLQLQAWSPSGAGAENPFRPGQSKPEINQTDLRQIVLQLSMRIEQLERRVQTLEKQSGLKTNPLPAVRR